MVETKALSKLTTIAEAQIINPVKATGMQRALLTSFGVPRLRYKNFVLHDKA